MVSFYLWVRVPSTYIFKGLIVYEVSEAAERAVWRRFGRHGNTSKDGGVSR